MKSSRVTIKDRFEKRSLPNLLVHKFLTEYGYDHGPVIARAIVEDILATIERCYPDRIPPKTVVWLAVRREWKGQRKGLAVSDLVPVRLRMVSDEEIGLLMAPKLRREYKACRAFNRARYARWCWDAYEQGGVLTLLDLSLLSGLSAYYVGRLLREHEAQTGQVVPTRGTVHDVGGSVTHKAEVIRRWLRRESPARIARDIKHSQGAVDRYIADFEKVRLLAQKLPLDDLPASTGLSKHLVEQYVALLREYESQLALYREAPSLESPTIESDHANCPDEQ
ncbi:MAG: DUF1670 domain-containing protein [Anaerolineales bacterium]|nr:DUF1670 domain-containing protein [Anaerolineales bacterium]